MSCWKEGRPGRKLHPHSSVLPSLLSFVVRFLPHLDSTFSECRLFLSSLSPDDGREFLLLLQTEAGRDRSSHECVSPAQDNQWSKIERGSDKRQIAITNSICQDPSLCPSACFPVSCTSRSGKKRKISGVSPS